MKPSLVIGIVEATSSFKIGAGLLGLYPDWSVCDLVYKARVAVKNYPLQSIEIAIAALVLFSCSLDGQADAEARMARFNAFLIGLLGYACRVVDADADCACRSQSMLHDAFVRQQQSLSRGMNRLDVGADDLKRQPAAEVVETEAA